MEVRFTRRVPDSIISAYCDAMEMNPVQLLYSLHAKFGEEFSRDLYVSDQRPEIISTSQTDPEKITGSDHVLDRLVPDYLMYKLRLSPTDVFGHEKPIEKQQLHILEYRNELQAILGEQQGQSLFQTALASLDAIVEDAFGLAMDRHEEQQQREQEGEGRTGNQAGR